MFTASAQFNVTLICGPTDMRKAIDGLCNIVAYDLEKEPCSDHIFVFCGRARDKVKILQWASNGFWLHYKRLEDGHFQWPGIDDEQLSIQISPRQLNWLLDGLALNVQEAHPHLTYRYHDDLGHSLGIIQAMNILPDDLPNDIDSLKALLLEQSLLLGKKDAQIAEWESKYQRILEQWRLAQQKQFGKGSEVSPGQGELFDESGSDSQEVSADVEADSQTVFYARTKPKRKPLPKDLPRETVVVDLSESDKICACCQTPLHRIGEDTTASYW